MSSLERFRGLVQSYISKHQYDSAVFWADKAVTLSKGDPEDVYMLAQSLYLTRQYHRAAHLIRNRRLDKLHKAGKYLAAKCLAAVRNWEEALNVLDGSEGGDITILQEKIDDSKAEDQKDGQGKIPLENVESSIALLKGQIYEALENRVQAAECYRQALILDVHCYEAFELLVKHQMLTADEERDLLQALPITEQCPTEEQEFLRSLYHSILKKYDKPVENKLPDCLLSLANNLDVQTNTAERHYYNCDFRTSYKITRSVLESDPFHERCLPVHVATLVELRLSNELFYLAHRLVDLHPDKAVSWFAVGCYYYIVGKNEPARRFLSKATAIDRLYGPAWLAFGHSFAAEGEHDQAMAAYFTASRLMKGCHLPLLYVGLEYGLTRNFKLADKFFNQALGIACNDPFVLHEMGVVAFHNGDWETAATHFNQALTIVQNISSQTVTDKWEPLLNNLGHVYRKLKKYEKALDCHRQALVLSPQNPSTFSAIGYVYALTGQFSRAIDYFHKALGVGRDDTFSVTMLTHSIEQYIGEMSPCEGGSETVPDLEVVVKEEVVATTEKSNSSLDMEIEMDEEDTSLLS
ncbi:cell division cycle protein 16 homolog [Diadema setosum]|uniref:cell division cycle protein 16 homolog n=1 Tax=Diadema setosum TaxID=31175 RepID=UPI003B3A32F4